MRRANPAAIDREQDSFDVERSAVRPGALSVGHVALCQTVAESLARLTRWDSATGTGQ
jgi:hypothetical protein